MTNIFAASSLVARQPGWYTRGVLALLVSMLLSGIPSETLAQEAPVESAGSLKVLCYNIHHGRGLDDRVDLQRIGRVINELQPDLVALQEVDQRTRRTGKVDQVAELARITGLHGCFGKQIDYEGGNYGQAILSRFPVSEEAVHWLPGEPQRERRIVLSVSVTIPNFPGKSLTFASTHLHHANEDYRIRQAEALNKLGSGWQQPVILAGDLNALPESSVLRVFQHQWSNATSGPGYETFPTGQPERQLDYVLYTPQDTFRVKNVRVIKSEASDHLPLLVEFAY